MSGYGEVSQPIASAAKQPVMARTGTCRFESEGHLSGAEEDVGHERTEESRVCELPSHEARKLVSEDTSTALAQVLPQGPLPLLCLTWKSTLTAATEGG